MMNIMTDYQRDLVLEHLDLVTQVIRKRIKVNGSVMLTFDDFYSVGCEALCHAAMRYTPARGEFSPFAAVLIYNAIIDYCRKHNRLMNTHSDLPTEPDNESISLRHFSVDYDIDSEITCTQIAEVVSGCKARYTGIAKRGIEALELKCLGYSSREIAEHYGTTVNNVNAWISRARMKLMQEPTLIAALN